MLVEEARVEVEDALADYVEAEVPGLDHACMDRANRDLVDPLSLDRDGPARRAERMGDKRAQRLVAAESQAIEVMRLALVPAPRRNELDDRGQLVRGGDGGKTRVSAPSAKSACQRPREPERSARAPQKRPPSASAPAQASRQSATATSICSTPWRGGAAELTPPLRISAATMSEPGRA